MTWMAKYSDGAAAARAGATAAAAIVNNTMTTAIRERDMERLQWKTSDR
jgi:hypothetical protein